MIYDSEFPEKVFNAKSFKNYKYIKCMQYLYQIIFNFFCAELGSFHSPCLPFLDIKRSWADHLTELCVSKKAKCDNFCDLKEKFP